MNPFLTSSGRWLLISGIMFLFLGILVVDPIVLLLGQIQIVVLATSFLLGAPGALALDRRMVSLEVEPGETLRAGTGHLVGDVVEVDLCVENHAGVALHNLRTTAFGPEALDIEEREEDVLYVGPSRRSVTRFEVTGTRSGRWMLHGFDVSVSDPLGLVETRDYLPANHAFEFYPRAGRLRTRRPLRYRAPMTRSSGGRHIVSRLGQGTDIRELRDYQPGDSLRDIAWKQTMRQRKLIAREFEREVTSDVYFALDVSSSMRGGQWAGQKLEYAVHLLIDYADQVLAERDNVGLLTFDEKLYGHVEPGTSPQHFQRILHHLVGLNSVVDAELTELDETEIRRLAADYLLVQERLDFRKGEPVDPESGVNVRLLDRWLSGVMEENELRFDSRVLREGVVDADVTPLRRFLQLRGVETPYRVEARLGMKERGFVEAVEHVVRHARRPHWIIVVTDLCGIMNLELLVKGVRLAQAGRHRVQFLVPFTPAFYQSDPTEEKREVLRELFSTAELEESQNIMTRLRSLGVQAHFLRPGGVDLQELTGRSPGA